jgi:hypothetical protein
MSAPISKHVAALFLCVGDARSVRGVPQGPAAPGSAEEVASALLGLGVLPADPPAVAHPDLPPPLAHNESDDDSMSDDSEVSGPGIAAAPPLDCDSSESALGDWHDENAAARTLKRAISACHLCTLQADNASTDRDLGVSDDTCPLHHWAVALHRDVIGGVEPHSMETQFARVVGARAVSDDGSEPDDATSSGTGVAGVDLMLHSAWVSVRSQPGQKRAVVRHGTVLGRPAPFSDYLKRCLDDAVSDGRSLQYSNAVWSGPCWLTPFATPVAVDSLQGMYRLHINDRVEISVERGQLQCNLSDLQCVLPLLLSEIAHANLCTGTLNSKYFSGQFPLLPTPLAHPAYRHLRATTPGLPLITKHKDGTIASVVEAVCAHESKQAFAPGHCTVTLMPTYRATNCAVFQYANSGRTTEQWQKNGTTCPQCYNYERGVLRTVFARAKKEAAATPPLTHVVPASPGGVEPAGTVLTPPNVTSTAARDAASAALLGPQGKVLHTVPAALSECVICLAMRHRSTVCVCVCVAVCVYD